MAIADMVFNPPTGLNDATYSPQTPANEASARSEIQGVSDQLRDYINNILKPQMVALNIPITAITDLDGANLQTIIQSIRDKLKATADGSSGADYVNATAIDGLVGATVQTLLEALKAYVDTHKISSDHDTRYYSKDQLQSITTGSSGADIIKSTPISANSGNTVQAQLAWLLAQISIAATGAIPDGSIGQEKLTLLLSTKIDTALSNTGLLSTLTTDDKSSLVNALNEVLSKFTTHKADNLYQTAGGTATAITLTINETLVNGLSITFIAGFTDSTTTKTINGKHFYKPNTTTSPSTVAGKAYTVWYNSSSDCFFIKASAEGNTVVGHVLAGDTFSNDSDTGLTGTMNLSNLISTNIKNGVTINNVTGNLQPKQSPENYVKNITWGGVRNPIGFIDGEGLWVYDGQDGTHSYVKLYDINGTLQKTVTINTGGANIVAIHATKNYIVWLKGMSIFLTDKIGTNFSANLGLATNPISIASINENKGIIYYTTTLSQIVAINLSNTAIYNIQNIYGSGFSMFLCETGIILIMLYSNQTELYYINDNGTWQQILNGTPNNLFATALVN